MSAPNRAERSAVHISLQFTYVWVGTQIDVYWNVTDCPCTVEPTKETAIKHNSFANDDIEFMNSEQRTHIDSFLSKLTKLADFGWLFY
jgi:hypothetical protein